MDVSGYKKYKFNKRSIELHYHLRNWSLPFSVDSSEYLIFIGFLCFSIIIEIK